jgi:hypothetical protein
LNPHSPGFAGEEDQCNVYGNPVSAAMYYLMWAWRMEKKRTRMNRFKVSGKAALIGNRDTYFEGMDAGADDIDYKHAVMERNIAAVSFITKLTELDIVPRMGDDRHTLRYLLLEDNFEAIKPFIARSFRFVPNLMEGEPAELQVDSLLQSLCYAYVIEFSMEPRLGSKVSGTHTSLIDMIFNSFSHRLSLMKRSTLTFASHALHVRTSRMTRLSFLSATCARC